MDKAVAALEYVVSQDPLYKDSLTYLGRAYYRKGRYQDAFAILQRALAVNKDDEIAWIAIGLAQLRIGQNEKGIESLKGGITLANKVMMDGYHDYLYWDTRGLIRNALRRSAFLVTKGLEEKKISFRPPTVCWQWWTMRKTSRGIPIGRTCVRCTAASRASVVSHVVCTLSKTALVVIPAEAGIQNILKSWIPARASYRQLGRNDVQISLPI